MQDSDRVESYEQDTDGKWIPMGEDQSQKISQNVVTNEAANDNEKTPDPVVSQTDRQMEERNSKQKSNQILPKKIEESKDPIDENEEAELTEMDADLISF